MKSRMEKRDVTSPTVEHLFPMLLRVGLGMLAIPSTYLWARAYHSLRMVVKPHDLARIEETKNKFGGSSVGCCQMCGGEAEGEEKSNLDDRGRLWTNVQEAERSRGQVLEDIGTYKERWLSNPSAVVALRSVPADENLFEAKFWLRSTEETFPP